MWLEVGCPFCSTVVTFPRSVEGRSVRCPECDKSYLIPVPNAATVAAARASLKPIAPIAEAEPVPSSSGPTGISAAQSRPESVVAPTIAAATARSTPAGDASEVEVRADTKSPLPMLAILGPPQRSADGRIVGNSGPAASPSPAPKMPAASAVASPSPMSGNGGPGSPATADRGRSAQSPRPTEPQRPLPVPASPPSAAATAESHEAQLRMRRTEIRAMANLIIFLVGTAAMLGFAWAIIWFSRRR